MITAASDPAHKAWRVSEPLARIARGEAPAPAITPLGDDARAQVIRDFVAAFNSGDAAAMRAFRARSMVSREGGPTEEQRDATTKRMRDDFGTLRVEGVLAKDEGSIATRMTDAQGRSLKFRFEFTPENRIAGIGIEME